MGRRRTGEKVDGWIVLDKPAGMTSSRAVSRVRGLLRARKAGHAGTLDPLATGILPIGLGEATKAMPFVVDATKDYRFGVTWGAATKTDDTEGAVIAKSPQRPAASDIMALLPRYTGRIAQVPPAYSAIRVDGERAYDLARAGAPPELRAREVTILSLELLDHAPDGTASTFRLRCEKGVYVRALARDMGAALGCYGHVRDLRRTRVGPFDETRAISLENLEQMGQSAPPRDIVLPVATALDDIPALAVTEDEASRLRCGQALNLPTAKAGILLTTCGGAPVALAEVDGGRARPLRVFNL